MPILEFLIFNFWIILVLTITYLFFFFFLPKAFSNIPFRVAPDLVAPSPNFATRLFPHQFVPLLRLI